MALGDGIRRNLATVTKEERDRLRDAILSLQTQHHHPGIRADSPAGGVSYWFKQDEVHAHTHVHGVPAFVPWHREFLNRFEADLRMVDPQLSLHYWDWTQDPTHAPDGQGGFVNLFTPEFMGSPSGLAREPFQAAASPYRPDGLYVPGANPFRSTNEFDPNNNPFDPPQEIRRSVQAGAPVPSDAAALAAATFRQFHDEIRISHDNSHGHIGGTLGGPHTSFRDPFVFLLHSNLDRLWAMWQRAHGHPERLDPAHVYDYSPTDWVNPNTGSPQPETGSGDVSSGDPWWGFSSPLEPWASPGSQTTSTGIIANVQATRPWAPPENQQVFKDCRHPTVVRPPSYDTVPHSSYFILNRDTFSSSEVAVSPTFPAALYIVFDGFQPREVPTPTASNPAITFVDAQTGNPVTALAAINPAVSLEAPAGPPDVPQRVTIAYDIQFTDPSVFTGITDPKRLIAQVTLNYTVGGTGITETETIRTVLTLVAQPNPYMIDVQGGNPSWLSVDTRVLQIQAGGTIGGAVHGADTQADAPFQFIQAVGTNFNDATMFPNDANHPFLTQTSADENASVLELARSRGGHRVYNYAIAKVRYKAPAGVDAQNVRVFFRVFSTMTSALDYDHVSGPTGNYRRAGSGTAAAPLLGIQGHEIASIPFFAGPRVDTAASSMTTQTDAAANTRTMGGAGATEQVAYFGCWLDINLAATDPHGLQFPLDPTSDPGGPDGAFTGTRQTIQSLVRGFHQCLVAEVHFDPPGGGDPIPTGSTPASSDRLAQRNLAIVESGNPSWPSTHAVQQTFLIKPSGAASFNPAMAETLLVTQQPRESAAARRKKAPTVVMATEHATRTHVPDELMISWLNLPAATTATIYLPEVAADGIVALDELRQHPAGARRVDDHTIEVAAGGITYVPIPFGRTGNLAGMISLVLPNTVRTGETYRLVVHQYSGVTGKILGAFQMTIPVRDDEEILPKELSKLAVLRFIQTQIPAGDRWHPIFVRYVAAIADRVRGFGGDPDGVKPSPDGWREGPREKRHQRERDDDDDRGRLLGLTIPWEDCDIDGEVEIRLRIHRRAD